MLGSRFSVLDCSELKQDGSGRALVIRCYEPSKGTVKKMFGIVGQALIFVAEAFAQGASAVPAKPALTRDTFGMEAIDIPLADGYLHLWNFGLIPGQETDRQSLRSASESSFYLNIQNNTSHQWRRLELRLTFEGHCRGITTGCTSVTKTQTWSYPVVLSEQRFPRLGSAEFLVGDRPVVDCYDEPPCPYSASNGFDLVGLARASSDAHLVAVMLVSANDTKGVHVEAIADRNYINLTEARRAADAAENELQAARKAERIRREAEQAKEMARRAAADDERRKEDQHQRDLVRRQCVALFKATSSKKVVDLTVAEAQDIRVCQGLGLYAAR